jgi:hypothetical protein
VGFSAHHLWTHLRSGSLFPEAVPLATLRFASASFPVGSSYSCLEPLPVRVLGNLSTLSTFPPVYCSSPCEDKTPGAGSPGFPAFAEIRFVGFRLAPLSPLTAGALLPGSPLRDEASFRPRCHFPKDLDQFQKTGAEALYF